jgi:hypothetical protein
VGLIWLDESGDPGEDTDAPDEFGAGEGADPDECEVADDEWLGSEPEDDAESGAEELCCVADEEDPVADEELWDES